MRYLSVLRVPVGPRNLSNIGILVGAVGIENTTRRNFKELEGMLGDAKALKRNDRECKGILIGPSMAPRFFSVLEFLRCVFFLAGTEGGVGFGPNFAARMASRQPNLPK